MHVKSIIAALLVCFCLSTLAAQEVIILQPRVHGSVERAAEDLADVIEARSGHRPIIRRSRLWQPEQGIYIGNMPAARRALPLPNSLSWFGSVYREARGERVYLRARNTDALVHGIYRYAHTEYGARWFLPGEDTLFLSSADASAVADTRMPVLQEPTFVQRQVGSPKWSFYRRNALNQPYRFNHALARIFDPALFETNPELFAQRGNGQPFGLSGSLKYDAQPHLASPAVADYAAKAVLAHFEEHPEAKSFSLATNDNIRFDESAATRALVEPIQYFRERPNYSDLVFTFMNRVAERVFDQAGAWSTPAGEPRYLTALAYYWAEAAPSFPLHPRILPVLTADRSQWQDPEFRAEDKALIEEWSRSGVERLGTWDYYYGAPYPYPRQFNQWIVESIRHLAANGVDVFYTPMPYMLSYEGPKAYLTAQLLWDPWQDVEVLLNEFYEGVFGPASSSMRAFYEAFERMHNERSGRAQWIKFYMDEAGVEKFSSDFLEVMEGHLRTAQAESAGHPEISQRIKRIRGDFEVTRIYRRLQAARREIAVGLERAPDADFLAAIEAFTQSREELQAKLRPLYAIERYEYNFRLLKDGAQSDPTPAALGALARYGTLDGEPALAPYLTEAQSKTVEHVQNYLEKPLPATINPNPSLWQADPQEDGRYLFPQPMPQIRGWSIDLRPSEKLVLSSMQAMPDRGLRMSGADIVSFFADVAVEGGASYLLQAAFSFHASPDNRTRLELIWYDSEGSRLASKRIFQAPVEWAEPKEGRAVNLLLPARAPEKAARLRLRFSASRQYDGDFLEVSEVRLWPLSETKADN